MKLEGGFINNLSKVYGIYTLGFLGFVILMAILAQVGVSADAIGWMFVGCTIAIYALIGVLSRTMESGKITDLLYCRFLGNFSLIPQIFHFSPSQYIARQL